MSIETYALCVGCFDFSLPAFITCLLYTGLIIICNYYLCREEKVADQELIREERRKQGEVKRVMKENQLLQEKTAEVQTFIVSHM